MTTTLAQFAWVSTKAGSKVSQAPKKQALMVELSYSLIAVLPALLGRLRNLFDFSAHPQLIAQHLMKDKMLKKNVYQNQGLRVPGAFDVFEMAVRAILGQQITVKAATTLACRFAEAFGEKIETPYPELNRLTPLPQELMKASIDDIAKLGIISSRAKSIIALANAFVSGQIQFDVGINPELIIKKLVALPGIRSMDSALHRYACTTLAGCIPKRRHRPSQASRWYFCKKAESMSQLWRPWRSYAVIHIWHNPSIGGKK